MAWSNEVTFKFIDLYKNEPAIWNPRNKFYRDKTKLNEAWERISDEMGVPVDVLKKKKETLMAAFRLNHKRKLASLRSVIAKDVFKPLWIFYEPMAAYLSDLYDCKTGNSNSDDGASSFTFQEKWDLVAEIGVEELSNCENENSQDASRSSAQKRHRSETPEPGSNETPHQCDTFLTHAMSTLSNVITNSLNRNVSDDEDECDIYSRLLAKKLRRLPDIERLELMYEIDTLFIQKRIKVERLVLNED